jgi:hypothetical protein
MKILSTIWSCLAGPPDYRARRWQWSYVAGTGRVLPPRQQRSGGKAAAPRQGGRGTRS